VVRLDAPLFFANCPHFENAVEKMVEEENLRAADVQGKGVEGFKRPVGRWIILSKKTMYVLPMNKVRAGK
jgi:MFS superfamily sulfate permease-like transporter